MFLKVKQLETFVRSFFFKSTPGSRSTNRGFSTEFKVRSTDSTQSWFNKYFRRKTSLLFFVYFDSYWINMYIYNYGNCNFVWRQKITFFQYQKILMLIKVINHFDSGLKLPVINILKAKPTKIGMRVTFWLLQTTL